MIIYNKLWETLKRKKLRQQFLIDNGIHRATVYKLKRNQNVNTETINLLCQLLDCKISDIMEYIKE